MKKIEEGEKIDRKKKQKNWEVGKICLLYLKQRISLDLWVLYG